MRRLALLFLLLFVCSVFADTITGTVKNTNYYGAVKLFGSKVELLDGSAVVASTTVDADGVYTMQAPAGYYLLKVTRSGYNTHYVPVYIEDKSKIDISVPERKSYATIYGLVNTNNLISLKVVALKNGLKVGDTQVLPNGLFVLSQIPLDTLDLVVSQNSTVIFKKAGVELADTEPVRMDFSIQMPSDSTQKNTSTTGKFEFEVLSPSDAKLGSEVLLSVTMGGRGLGGQKIEVKTPSSSFFVVSDDSGFARVLLFEYGKYSFSIANQTEEYVLQNPVVIKTNESGFPEPSDQSDVTTTITSSPKQDFFSSQLGQWIFIAVLLLGVVLILALSAGFFFMQVRKPPLSGS